MFLQTIMERNQPLVRLGIKWQQEGLILPDTYLVDLDTIVENARCIQQEAGFGNTTDSVKKGEMEHECKTESLGTAAQ